MPFLSLPLLRHMLWLAASTEVVIPRLAAGLEPLHAIYSKACLPAMARALEAGQRRIVAFLDEVRVHYVEEDEVDRYDPRHLSFVNVNKPEDWWYVQQLAAEHDPPSP
jgi:molybdopterin-guanine dinucleotide biosynthesis protein A